MNGASQSSENSQLVIKQNGDNLPFMSMSSTRNHGNPCYLRAMYIIAVGKVTKSLSVIYYLCCD